MEKCRKLCVPRVTTIHQERSLSKWHFLQSINPAEIPKSDSPKNGQKQQERRHKAIVSHSAVGHPPPPLPADQVPTTPDQESIYWGNQGGGAPHTPLTVTPHYPAHYPPPLPPHTHPPHYPMLRNQNNISFCGQLKL